MPPAGLPASPAIMDLRTNRSEMLTWAEKPQTGRGCYSSCSVPNEMRGCQREPLPSHQKHTEWLAGGYLREVLQELYRAERRRQPAARL